MNRFSHTTLCTAITAVLLLAACKQQENQAAVTAASQPKSEFITQVQPTKTDGTVGMFLPDFAQLVAREGAAVVHIQAVRDHNQSRQDGNEDPFAEFFKRIVPNQPDFGESESDMNFGSGVIISQDGYIMTNAHVVKGHNTIKVTLNDKREYPAKLIGADDKSDIALLKIESDQLPAAKIGNPDQLQSGEWVAAIGAPFGFENSVTAGIVSAKNRSLPDENYTPFIQTDVAINPGNSGGPLYNLKGEVVGINSQIYSRSGGFMGISFAIPIDVAMHVADQLKATGKVQRGQLGVVIQEVSHDLAKSFGLDKPVGALIVSVIPDSPADGAGLQVGDIIISVNGEEVLSSRVLPMAIGALAPGKEVKLGIWRKGKAIETTVKLSSLDTQKQTENHSLPHKSEHTGGFELPKAGLTLAEHADKNGLTVIAADGAAARAGLRRGDVIREIDGKPVGTQEQTEQALAQAGQTVAVLVERQNNTVFIALVLP